MRAHEPKKTARRTGVSGAYLHIKARLFWLLGFPRGNQWISVPDRGVRGVETLAIDATLRRRAAYSLRKLRGDFQRALGRIFDDPQAWISGVEAVLEALHPVVHRGEAPAVDLLGRGLFSRSVEKRIAGLSGDARDAARRLTWVYATRPKDLPKAVRWLEARPVRPRSAVIDVQLSHLAVSHGGPRVAVLDHLLSDPALDDAPSHGGRIAIQPAITALTRTSTPTDLVKPKHQPRAKLEKLLAKLLTLDSKRQRLTLTLFSASDIIALTQAWQTWWNAATTATQKVQNVCKTRRPTRKVAELLDEHRKKLVRLRENHPPPLRFKTFIEAVELASGDPKRVRATTKLLDAFPRKLGDACALITHVGLLSRPDDDTRSERIPRVLQGLRSFVASAGENDHVLAPWRKAVHDEMSSSHQWPNFIEADLIEVDFPDSRIPAVYKALTALASDIADKSFDDVARRVVQIFEVVSDPERVIALVRALHSRELHGRWLDSETIKGIDAAADIDSFDSVVEPLLRLHEATSELSLSTVSAALLDAVAGDHRAMQAVLTGGDLSLLVSAGQRLALLRKLRVGRPSRQAKVSETTWTAAFPTPLHESLRLLAAANGEDAPAIAEKVLARFVRSKAALRRERDAIRERLAGPLSQRQLESLQARIERLDERIEAPVELDDKQLAKARTKLHRRAARDLLTTSIERSDRLLEDALQRRLELESIPAWLLEARPLRALGAAVEQRVNIDLVLKLLRARCGAPPWDLRAEAPNARFIKSCRSRGIDMSPWLDGLPPRVIGRGEKAMTLRFEDDPLEIFYMGQHFGTCLSLNQCNYFSVFANAADINKRVIFARDRNGTVVARRLVCLSDRGAIVAFRAYSHDLGAGFKEASDELITDLCAAMGTVTIPRGPIPTLVANDWYDDGSVDVANAFEFLADESDFRKRLLKVEPTTLGALIHQATGRSMVDGILAPMLAALPEVNQRPEIAIELVRRLEEPHSLPGDVAVSLASAIVKAGEPERAATLFADSIEQYIVDFHRAHRWLAENAISVLVVLRPSRALAVLRKTRERWVRRWTDEWDTNRLLAGAQSLARLHRYKQAAALLEHLLVQTQTHNREAAKTLLKELADHGV